MVKFLINRPVAVFTATLAFLLLGLVSSLRIPTSLMPDIDIPKITIQLDYPNSTARDLETNVVRILRNNLIQLSDLKDIETETRDGAATLELLFQYGTNTDLAFIETNEKIDAALNYLPKDLERPKVIKASATDIPVLNLTVALKKNNNVRSFLNLSEFSEVVLKKRLEQLPEVALADMSGQSQAEITVVPKVNKLRNLGIENDELINAIKQNNFQLGTLTIQKGIYQYNFKLLNPLREINDLESIYLNINDKIFKLNDLANISLMPELERGLVDINGNRGIVFSIIKKSDTKISDLKASLNEVSKSFQEDYPDLDFSVNQDQTELLKSSIDNLKSSLWIGGLLAMLVMFFFNSDIKSPLIISVSIPVSIILSLLLMYVLGLSINIVSLSGLILGVGMMIDNAIIVTDNIIQKLESGLDLFESCIRGTNEIITPLTSSVLTTCSVFLPLLFLSGITGALFYDQAIAVALGLSSSLIVSIVFIPVIFKQLKGKSFRSQSIYQSRAGFKGIENWYEKVYHFLFNRRKWIIYVISITSIIIGVILFQKMEYSQLPVNNQTETIAIIDWNDNVNVKENKNRVQSILKDIPNIDINFSLIGEQQFLLQKQQNKSSSEASIYLSSSSVRKLKEIEDRINQKILENYPNANIIFETPKNLFQYIFGTNKSQLIAQVYSKSSTELPSEDNLSEIANLLAYKTDTKISLKEAIEIRILHENLLLYEVSYNDLINELKSAFNKNLIDNLRNSKKSIPIKLNYNIVEFETLTDQLFVKNNNGVYIPIKKLIKTKVGQHYKTINANSKGEYIGYDIKTSLNSRSEMSSIKEIFRDNKDFNVRFDGGVLEMSLLKQELIIVILVAILLLYFIMAAQFESLWQPLVILLELPIDIGGALFLLWIFGGTINIMSAIGIVVMSGIIINDSILKIHTINLLRKQGINLEEAIKLGGKLRLKPILMTSLTTILALTPFLFMKGLGPELQKPLALTVIGGMIIGTFISLYFIPLVYLKFAKLQQRNNKLT